MLIQVTGRDEVATFLSSVYPVCILGPLASI